MSKALAILLTLGLAAPLWAQPKTGVQVQIKPHNDRIEVEVRSATPLEHSLRSVSGHSELKVGKGPVVGAGTTRIDRGLLQKVEVLPLKSGAEIRVFAISNPRSSVRLSPDKKTLIYTVSLNDLATAPGAASLFVPTPKPTPVPARSPVATATPLPVATPEPTPVPAATPAPTPIPVATPAPTPVTVAIAQKPVTLTIDGKDLPTALAALAAAAGLKAEIAPTVQGFVTASFTDIPLNQALTTMLGQQSELYEYKLTETTLTVFGGGGGGTTVRTGRVVREYFPVKDPQKAADVLLALKRTVPELTYSVDERLNTILAEGDPADLERARKVLAKVAGK